MQKWEYISVEAEAYKFVVLTSAGMILETGFYSDIDPNGTMEFGKNDKGEKVALYWHTPYDHSNQFLLRLLNKLGSEGWEAIGNVHTQDSRFSHILLKRPMAAD